MTKEENHENEGISRRDLLIGAGAAATALAGGSVYAGDHAGHRHEDHAPRHPKLLDTVNNCLDKGQRCIAHCLVSFTEGDTSLADCASKTHEMEAVCKGFSYLVTANSSYTKDYARICKTVCGDCKKECDKHADQHTECKECAEACQQVIKAVDKLLA
ncbi:MAG: four-helix bundle copper-binding protein [Pseudomonadota bacterium]